MEVEHDHLIWDHELNKFLYHAYFDLEKGANLAEQAELLTFIEVF